MERRNSSLNFENNPSSGVTSSRLRICSHCPAKFSTKARDRASPSIRRISDSRFRRSKFLSASAKRRSSGMELQRKYERRDASVNSSTLPAVKGRARALAFLLTTVALVKADELLRNKKCGETNAACTARPMPCSKLSPRCQHSPARFTRRFTSSGVTGRRYARRTKRPRISRATSRSVPICDSVKKNC